jgi:AraC-like DNA-binding protein
MPIFDFMILAMSQEPAYFSQQVGESRRWFLAFPQPGDPGIVTVSVGCEHCLAEYVVERDGFEFQGLECVIAGEGTVELGGETHLLQAGAVFGYGPGIPHRIANTGGRPLVKYFLDCGGKYAKRQFHACSIGGGRKVQVANLPMIVELFELLISNATAETEHSERICAYLTESLLKKITEQTIAGGTTDMRSWNTYDRIRRHIHRHHLRLRAISEVAREVGVEAAYLSRVFRRFHGSPPYQYLMRLKMHHAASLLLNPATLVKDVAGELGFTDPFHFSRSFKAVYGISPAQFLRRMRGAPTGQ